MIFRSGRRPNVVARLTRAGVRDRRDDTAPIERYNYGMLLSLPQTHAHLWHLTSEDLTAHDLRQAAHRLIPAGELAHSDRFLNGRARDSYLAARAFVRCVLSQYVEVDPRSWAFASDLNGKPEIAAPAVARSLRFNLSHTDGLLTCIVALHRDIGVDTEAIDRAVDIDAIAGRFFAPSEMFSLQALSPLERRQRFFELWTLKESYLKARSVGLSLPLDKFAFVVDTSGAIDVVFDADFVDDFEELVIFPLMPEQESFDCDCTRPLARRTERLA